MSRTTALTFLAVLSLAVAAALAVPSPTADESEATVTVDGTVDLPGEPTSVADTRTAVSGTVGVAPGEPVRATVSPGGDGPVTVALVDASGERHAAETVDDRGRVSVSTDGLDTGTYYLVVGDAERGVQRVVVSAADVSLSRTESNGSGLSTRVGVIPHSEVSYDAVELVVTDGETARRYTATPVRDGLYEASVPERDLPAGRYEVYARLVDDSGEYVGTSDPLTVSGGG